MGYYEQLLKDIQESPSPEDKLRELLDREYQFGSQEGYEECEQKWMEIRD